jgi:hypothetical protein
MVNNRELGSLLQLQFVLILSAALLLAIAALYITGIAFDWYGELENSGQIEAQSISEEIRAHQDKVQFEAAKELGIASPGQILFGDLHVHTTFSSDAFRMSLPMVQGDGAHPPSDACDFARVCSALDFWALTDHAESLTASRWKTSIASVQQCNALAGDSANPDMVTFMGFEWTQAGSSPDTHYGHKNVIFRETSPKRLPARPISSPFRAAFASIPLKLRLLPPLRDLPNRQRYYDFNHLIQAIADQPLCPEQGHVRDFPADCAEIATTPAELFRKLSEWDLDSIVIPHGTTWGVYSPAGTSLDKQLVGNMNDPERQTLIEVFSGHGNSEVYRDWSATEFTPDGQKSCPQPRPDYLPSCWQAGELIRQRCAADGLSEQECELRAREARQQYVDYGQVGWHTVPGTRLTDWLDAGQCRDCFLPAFNYRPRGSAQYGLAITNFDNPDKPAQFRFGFIASSDNHSARPGTGYKQYARHPMTDWWGYRDAQSRSLYSTDRGRPDPESVAVDISKLDVFNILELERQASFFVTGGLAAVHARGRNRNAIWSALKRKEVYGTSGQRMLLWFDLLNPSAEAGEDILPMGSETAMGESPRFRARALGAFEQIPGCPEHGSNALSHERLELLCRGECYNPSNQRQAISRIEVIRIRPQNVPDEPVSPLIEDPWKSFDCDTSSSNGCEVEFTDPDFATNGRDTVYYVRALQASQSTINAGGLRCELDEQGQCIRVNACYGDDRTSEDDDCLEEVQHRAWSSPIFVDHVGSNSPDA